MILKRILCLLVSAVLFLTFCGCSKSLENVSSSVTSTVIKDETKGVRDYITLLYSSADTFNPYTLKTDVNRQLCRLLYDPLVRVSDEFEPIKALAKSIEIKGKTCTVTLKVAEFSDGAIVTAEDVKYSYSLAKKSKTAYSKKLYEVKSVEVEGDKIIFNLNKNDPYFANVLDFPIIKENSDKKTNSDSVLLPPIGCGRYKLNKNNDGLVINKKYYGKKGSIKKVKLINAPDNESVAHYTEIGAADIYFSEISVGNILRMSGTREEINLNNMVYIGVNRNYSPLNEQALRQAISAALNRTKICEESFYNNALPATGFFHPLWNETKAVQNIQIETNNEITIENLEEIGYNKLDSGGIRVNSNGISLQFTLLVNSENRIRVLAANTIASQLEAVGIGIKVIEMPYKKYKAALKKGDFQLYIGETKFTDNMDLSSIIMRNGKSAYGLPKKKAVKENESQKNDKTEKNEVEYVKTDSQKVLSEFYNGKNTIKDVAAVLQSEMPIIPVCYRTGVLFYNVNIENVNNSSVSDIYFSIDSYLIN